MTAIERCDKEMARAWNGDGQVAKAYLYTLWYLDWLQEKRLILEEERAQVKQ